MLIKTSSSRGANTNRGKIRGPRKLTLHDAQTQIRTEVVWCYHALIFSFDLQLHSLSYRFTKQFICKSDADGSLQIRAGWFPLSMTSGTARCRFAQWVFLCGFLQGTNGAGTWMHPVTQLHIIALRIPRNVRFAAQMELGACLYTKMSFISTI